MQHPQLTHNDTVWEADDQKQKRLQIPVIWRWIHVGFMYTPGNIIMEVWFRSFSFLNGWFVGEPCESSRVYEWFYPIVFFARDSFWVNFRMNSLRHAIISALLRYWPTTITSKQVEFWWKQVMLTGSKKLNTILGPTGGRGWIFFGTCHWHHSSWAPTLGVYITLFESLTSPNLCWTKMAWVANHLQPK